MELTERIMLTSEFATPVLLSCCFAFGYLIKIRVLKWFVCSASLIQVAVLAFRPEDYNSDTWNYSKYIDILASTNGSEILLATKFEPVHLALAWITKDFRLWLLLEALIYISLAILLIRRLARQETLAIVLGCSLPLYSSSLRFSVGLVAVAFAIDRFRQSKFSSVVASTAGLMTHISLAIAGFLRGRRLWVIGLVLCLFVVYTIVDPELLLRVGAGSENAAGGTGLRPFVTLLLFLTIVKMRNPEYAFSLYQKDILISVVIFAAAFFFFPVLNRWILLLLVAKSLEFDRDRQPMRPARRPMESVAATTMYLMLVIPQLASMLLRMKYGDW